MGIWSYFVDNRSEIESLAGTTLWLACLPLVAGFVLALPAGWLASRYRWTYPPIVSVGGLLYTIPSLVLFLVLPEVLGTSILSATNVAVALTIYTLALLMRIVADGLNSVSKDTLAAASAMGFTSWQLLRSVQIPLAVPVIGAGLRVASVSNVSLISVASIIGVSQLGQLFVEGNNNNSSTPTVVGLILFVVLALILDLIIVLGMRLLTPWQRVAR